MKISGPSKTSGTSGTSKTGAKGGGGDGAFGSMISSTEETAPNSAVSRTASIGALDALLTLQSADSVGEEAKRRAKKRGADLLDQLERIRIGLLTGELSKSALHQLATMVASQRDQVMDPHLTAILDEIDLRAQIELAKFDR